MRLTAQPLLQARSMAYVWHMDPYIYIYTHICIYGFSMILLSLLVGSMLSVEARMREIKQLREKKELEMQNLREKSDSSSKDDDRWPALCDMVFKGSVYRYFLLVSCYVSIFSTGKGVTTEGQVFWAVYDDLRPVVSVAILEAGKIQSLQRFRSLPFWRCLDSYSH